MKKNSTLWFFIIFLSGILCVQMYVIHKQIQVISVLKYNLELNSTIDSTLPNIGIEKNPYHKKIVVWLVPKR